MTEPRVVYLAAGESVTVTAACQPTPQPTRRPVAYSQRDPRWARQEYTPGNTFAANGCLVCSVAMLAALAYAEAPTPPDVALALRTAGAFVGGYLSRPARIPAAYARLEWGGVMHWRGAQPAPLDILAAEIARYGATIIEARINPLAATVDGNQHFLVAVAVVTDTQPAEVLVIDPWDGVEKALSASRHAAPAQWSAAQAVQGVRLVRPVV